MILKLLCLQVLLLRVVPAKLNQYSVFLRPSIFPNVPPYISFVEKSTRAIPKWLKTEFLWKRGARTLGVDAIIKSSGFEFIEDSQHSNNTLKAWVASWDRKSYVKAQKSKVSCFTPNYQKYNHLPGMMILGDKVRQLRSLKSYKQKSKLSIKEEFDFMPLSFILPTEVWKFKKAFIEDKEAIWIIKPRNQSCSHGIKFITALEQVTNFEFMQGPKVVVQKYLKNPYLVNNKKMELRVIVLITSVLPLRIYSLTSYAALGYFNYSEPIGKSSFESNAERRNLCMHSRITKTKCGIADNYTSSVPPPGTFYRKDGTPVKLEEIEAKLNDVIVKTIISAESKLVYSALKHLRNRYSAFHVLGFDFLLSSDTLRPVLLEVNTAPDYCFFGSLCFQKGIINEGICQSCAAMLLATLNGVGYNLPPSIIQVGNKKFQNLLFDERLYDFKLTAEDREKQVRIVRSFHKMKYFEKDILTNMTRDDIRALIIAEDEHSRVKYYKRIYPINNFETMRKYVSFVKENLYYSLLFQAWGNKYSGLNRSQGIMLLSKFASANLHLKN